MSYDAPQPPAATQPPLRPDEERTWSLLAHLGGILGFLPSLVIWLVFKGRGPFLDDQAKEALNFQITVTLAAIVAFVLSFVIPFLPMLVWVANVVFCILAAVAVSKGQWYRYPATLRLVK